MYEYFAQILRVVDGDTVHARVDLGFSVFEEMKLRLTGINAPELSTPEGAPARDHLLQLLGQYGPTGQVPLTIQTEHDRTEKYGRFLAKLLLPGNVDLNATMVADGFAVPLGPYQP